MVMAAESVIGSDAPGRSLLPDAAPPGFGLSPCVLTADLAMFPVVLPATAADITEVAVVVPEESRTGGAFGGGGNGAFAVLVATLVARLSRTSCLDRATPKLPLALTIGPSSAHGASSRSSGTPRFLKMFQQMPMIFSISCRFSYRHRRHLPPHLIPFQARCASRWAR